ncbi:MAG: hypothetical protein QW270_06680 [Candidatus Bathyarchaeia archaeon]
MTVENEINVKELIKKEILQYYNITFSNRNRRNVKAVTFKVDSTIYEDFINTLLDNHYRVYGNVGLTVEVLMRMFIDCFKVPKIVQTTLFYKPQINVQNVKAKVNIAQKLELKLVKQDLTNILDALDKGKGDKDFYVDRLREVLPRALHVALKIGDEELTAMLEKVERFI